MLELTKEQNKRKQFEATYKGMVIYSVDGVYFFANKNYDSQYIVDKFNPKIYVYSTLEEAKENA